MSTLDDLLGQGLDAMMEADPATFTFRGTSRAAVIGDLTTEGEWIKGGEKPMRRLQITFAFEAFSPALRTGEILTARGKQMKIVKIDYDATAIVFECEDVTGKK